MSLLAILACNMPQESPTPEIEMGVAQTQTAIAIEKVLATTTTTIQSSTFPTLTATSAVQTPASSPTWTATMVSQSTCTDRAKFIGENIPDDSVFAQENPL